MATTLESAKGGVDARRMGSIKDNPFLNQLKLKDRADTEADNRERRNSRGLEAIGRGKITDIISQYKQQLEDKMTKPRPRIRPTKRLSTSVFEVKEEETKPDFIISPRRKVIESPFKSEEKPRGPIQRPSKVLKDSPFKTEEKTTSPPQRPTKKVLTSPFEVKPEENTDRPLHRPTRQSIDRSRSASSKTESTHSTDSTAATVQSAAEPISNASDEPEPDTETTEMTESKNNDDDTQKELADLQSKVSGEKQTLESLQKDNMALKSQIEAEQTNNAILVKEGKGLEEEEQKMQIEEQQRKEQITMLNEQVQSLQKAVEEKRTSASNDAVNGVKPEDVDDSHQSNGNPTDCAPDEEPTDNSNEDEHSGLSAQDLKDRDAIIENLKAKMEENRNEIVNVSKSRDAEIKNGRKENESIRKQIEEYKAKMEYIRSQIEAQKERADSLEQKMKDREDVEHNASDEREKEQMTALMAKLRAVEKEKEEALEDINGRLKRSESDLRDEAETVKALKAMNDDLNERNGSLMMQSAELKERKKEMEEMAARVQQMEVDNEALKTQQESRGDSDGNNDANPDEVEYVDVAEEEHTESPCLVEVDGNQNDKEPTPRPTDDSHDVDTEEYVNVQDVDSETKTEDLSESECPPLGRPRDTIDKFVKVDGLREHKVSLVRISGNISSLLQTKQIQEELRQRVEVVNDEEEVMVREDGDGDSDGDDAPDIAE